MGPTTTRARFRNSRTRIIAQLQHWRSCPSTSAWRGGRAGENRAAAVNRTGTELLLDSDQLVVFGDPVRARQRSGLDLAAVGGDRQIGDRRIFGFARAVREHRPPPCPLSDLDRVKGLGEG